MARIDVTQEQATLAIVTRLRRELNLPESRCYEKTAEGAPGPHTPGGWWLVVSYDGESYDEGMQFGGGAAQLAVTGDVSITILTRIDLDQKGHDRELLRKADRGLMRVKRDVLRVLAGWDPTLPDGDTFARQFTVRGAGRFDYDERQKIGWHTIRCGLMFDWDLSE